MTKGEDSTLVAEAKKDPRQFGALYRKYYEAIYRFCYYRVNRHRETTEDLVSDVFIKALDNLSKYQDRGSPFVVWLYTIARNLITDYYRSGKVRLEGASDSIQWTSTGENIQNDVETKDLKTRVDHLIQTLPSSDQELLTLRFTSELGFAELGAILGTTEGATKMRYARIIEKLKNKLAQQATNVTKPPKNR